MSSPFRCILLLTALGLAAHADTPAVIAPATVPPKPNFLFIAIDDLKPIAGYLSEEPGNFLQSIYPDATKRAAIRKILTPHLDRLAAESTVFPRAACASPLCNPSRTALLTGIRPHHHGLYGDTGHFRQAKNPIVAQAVTLPQNLRTQGYYTAGSGKIFHQGSVELDPATGAITTDWPDSAHSWDTWINEHDAPGEGRKTNSPYSVPGDRLSFGSVASPVTHMYDYQRADLLARALEQGTFTVEDIKVKQIKTIDLTRKPFFLACGILKPQLPWFAPQEILDQLDAADLKISREFYQETLADLGDVPAGGHAYTDRPRGADQPGKGRFQNLLNQGKKIGGANGDLAAWREAVRHYLACIMVADRAVGRLLDGLNKSKFKDNTIVVLWSDHGWNLGTKYHLGENALWEESANCVLMIKDPRYPIAGQRSPAAVNLIDLYRTLAAAAEVTTPDHVAGANFSALLGDPARAWRMPSLTTTGAGHHSITDGRFRYIRYADDPQQVELYDHQSDPRELTNLIDVKKYAQVRSVFEAGLQQILTANPIPPPTAAKKPQPANATAGN